MKQIKNARRRNIKPLSHRSVRLIAVAAGIILLVAQLGYDVLTYRAISDGDRGATITQLINSAVSNLLKPAVIDPRTKQLYLPEANVVLPKNPASISGILYSYSVDGANGSDAELHITTTNAVNISEAKLRSAQAAQAYPFSQYNPDKIFDQVPVLQTCARGYTVHFAASARNYGVRVATKQLSDGRTAYIYREAGCSLLNDTTEAYITQLQSY